MPLFEIVLTLDNPITFLKFDPETFRINGQDKKDQNNLPSCYSKTTRGNKKAWTALSEQWTETTTMYGACEILQKNGRSHAHLLRNGLIFFHTRQFFYMETKLFTPDQKIVNDYVATSLIKYHAANTRSKAWMKNTVECIVDDYGDKVKFYQEDDYFGQGGFSAHRQMVRTKLEAAKIFLTKIA